MTTKLEELKAAWEAADAAWRAAVDDYEDVDAARSAALSAVIADYEAAFNAAATAYDPAWYARDAAYFNYMTELKKQENSDD
jgi:hypothetical protein